MHDLRVTVEEIRGFCDLPMRPGDYFELSGGRIYLPPDGYFCMWAMQSLMPMLPVKQRTVCDENDWIPRTQHMTCPDPDGMVIFRIDRLHQTAPLRTGKQDLVQVDEPVERMAPPPRMLLDASACTGCLACRTACEAIHSHTRIRPIGAGIEPRVCRQCGNAPCVQACPRGALGRDSETGAVRVEAVRCQACGACVSACPFEAITLPEADAEKVPAICDLCGADPACVKVCESGALRYGRPYTSAGP